MDCNVRCEGIPGRYGGGRPVASTPISSPGWDQTHIRQGQEAPPPAWGATYNKGRQECPPPAWDATYNRGRHEAPPPAWDATYNRGRQEAPPSDWSTNATYGQGSRALGGSTQNRSQIQEAIEDMGIVRLPEDTMQELRVVRPDPADNLDLEQSQLMDARDYEEYEGDPEITSVLGKESQVSVFDPEDLNLTMAPADNNFDTRRAQVLNALTREIEMMESRENELLHTALEEYHHSLRIEVASRMHHTV